MGDVLGHQIRAYLRPLDLLDVHGDLSVGEHSKLVAQLVDLCAALADHNARTGGVQRHHNLAWLALNLNQRQRGMSQAPTKVLANRLVLLEEAREILLGIPSRRPVFDDPETEPERVCLLSHILRHPLSRRPQ